MVLEKMIRDRRFVKKFINYVCNYVSIRNAHCNIGQRKQLPQAKDLSWTFCLISCFREELFWKKCTK